jgi:predicted phosphodiesterase
VRIAIVSDIHGNLTALEAVLADLRRTSPDLILHGGDLANAGSRPVDALDRIRDLGWPGVMGNADEMLANPESLEEFANNPPRLQSLFAVIREMAAAEREAQGTERLAWLGSLPRVQIHGVMALVHASPESAWRAPAPDASDDELESVYASLALPVVVYGHIHRPFVRNIRGMTMANTGSVSLSYDGDSRASYLLLDDDSAPVIQRVAYDMDKELKLLADSAIPHSGWIASMLTSSAFQMP